MMNVLTTGFVAKIMTPRPAPGRKLRLVPQESQGWGWGWVQWGKSAEPGQGRDGGFRSEQVNKRMDRIVDHNNGKGLSWVKH